MAVAHFTAGRYAEALSWAEASLRQQANFSPAWRLVTASSALLGRKESAQNAASRLLDLNPEFRISDLRDLIPLRRPEYLEKYQEGLRLAGLPE
jgi:tetratricopeptide (TPR) repeat protein